MYEFFIAFKYLLPRWRQLSVSMISLLSVLVIALVVWLVVVFFSVTQGLEKSWTHKLLAITAPVRILPTQDYYHSYYFLIDGVSSFAEFSLKSIGEKREAPLTEPYDPLIDEELPSHWSAPVRHSDGTLKDLVKELFAVAEAARSLGVTHIREFEMAPADVELFASSTPELEAWSPQGDSSPSRHSLHQSLYLATLDQENPSLASAFLPLSIEETQALTGVLLPAPATLAEQLQLVERLYPSLEPLFLPKSFIQAGVQVGDEAKISYRAVSPTAWQTLQEPAVVAGFYDPGILPIGSRLALARQPLVASVRMGQQLESEPLSNGLYLHLRDLTQAELVKATLEQALRDRQLDRYWRVESYHDYPLARDFLQQLQSERNLFTLLAAIVILVACSNIVSMLVILVNDKRQEIGILRAMGASSWSIAAIFGLCGIALGVLGSSLGIIAALFTLAHLQQLVALLSAMQGHDLLNPLFYGETLPTEVSYSTLLFVVGVTGAISVVAGLIPALKASWMRPSALLRCE